MTNTKLLKEAIKESGYKLKFIAEELGMTYAGLKLKIDNKNEFKVSEVDKLSKLLKMNTKLTGQIFFGK